MSKHLPFLIKSVPALIFALLFCAVQAQASSSSLVEKFPMFKPGSNINSKVEKAIDKLLASNKPGKPFPTMDDLAPLLEYMIIADGSSRSPHPEKRSEGSGIFWKKELEKPFGESLRYLYNPNIANELLYPAAIRRGHWLPGSDFLTLREPLWKMIESASEDPTVLRGREYEEITPDDFSGSYYIYHQNRMVLLFTYQDVPMVLSVTWQDGKSENGRKGGFYGQYNNWDFIFTKEKGATATGLGWMTTYMYASSAIALLYPQDDGRTGYAMFKWLKAGWSGMNAVKRSHILSGAERNFLGMLDVINNKTGLSVEELEEITRTAGGYDRPAMLKFTDAYTRELAKVSKNDEILERDEFQALLKNGQYAQHLSDDELRSLVKLIILKRKLGKPVLGE